MPGEKTEYTIELLCDYRQWWRYNVFIMAAGFDREGRSTGFGNFVDRVYDMSYGNSPASPPEGYDPCRKIEMKTPPCSYADLYIYIIANTFPESRVIRDSPDFDLVVRISAGSSLLQEKTVKVNQWGGLTISGYRIGPVES